MNRVRSFSTRVAATTISPRRVLGALVLAGAGVTLLPVAAEAETTLSFPAGVPDGMVDIEDSCADLASDDQADNDGDGLGAAACDGTSGGTAGQVTGGGWVNASRSSFGFNAHRSPNGTSATGVVTYQDKLAGVRITSTSITSVVITGTSATIIGRANVNGLAVDLRVEIIDLGEPGSSDSFEIFAGSYASGGILDGGNIQIHS